jgi:putative transposase
MPQSLAKVAIHIVYSTKDRRPWLRDLDLRNRCCAYAATVLKRDVDSPAVVINGTEDHVHMLCLLSRKFAIMELVKVCKTETAKWIKKQEARLEGFRWQAGYGVFSVSESNLGHVKRYIAKQEEHHQRISFQDEFRELCSRHGIEIDERYVWD